MSPRVARLLLWAAAALLVPLPFFLAQSGHVPAARIAMLGAITAAVAVVEGTHGMVAVAAAMLLAQALVYLLLQRIAAGLLVRLLGRLAPGALLPATLALVLLGAALSAGLDLYRDPFRARGLHANVLSVYE